MKNSTRNILIGTGIIGVIGIAIFLSSKNALAINAQTTSDSLQSSDIATFDDLLPIVNQYSSQYGVPQALIFAIMQQESGDPQGGMEVFDTNATLMKNPTEIKAGGSQGLMQILLSSAKNLGYTGDATGLYDPSTGIKYGVLYIKQVIHDGKGIDYTDVGDIAAQYNSNKNYIDAPSSTQSTYVPHVLKYYAYYVNKLAQYGISSPVAQALPSLSVTTTAWDTLTGWL